MDFSSTKPIESAAGDFDTLSPSGRYRIERRIHPGDAHGQGQRLVEAAGGEIVFDTSTVGCPTLLAFDTADIVILYALYRGEAMAYLIDPYRRLFSPVTCNMGWQPLSILPVWEQHRFEAFERKSPGNAAKETARLVDRAGKPLHVFPDRIGPGEPFPFVGVVPAQKPDTCALSPDGHYRIEGFLYRPNDGRFGEEPEELQRLVDAATGITILDEAETGCHATMTFEPNGQVQLRVGGFQARYYLLGPARRMYTRKELPEPWRPLSTLRETERAIVSDEHARWYAGRQIRTGRGKLSTMLFWAILGVVAFGGVVFLPPKVPWWDPAFRLVAACPFLLGIIYLLVALRELSRRK